MQTNIRNLITSVHANKYLRISIIKFSLNYYGPRNKATEIFKETRTKDPGYITTDPGVEKKWDKKALP